MMRLRIIGTVFVVTALISAGYVHAAAPQAEERLARAARGAIDVKRHEASGLVRFVRAKDQGDLQPRLRAGDDKARTFLRAHGALFGLNDADRQLQKATDKIDHLGVRSVTYQQQHNGVPVFGAKIKTAMDRDGRLKTVNGAALEAIDVNTVPNIGAADAAVRAKAHLRHSLMPRDLGKLAASDGKLYVYNAGFVRGRTGSHQLVFEVEVTGENLREFIYVDAHSGKIADQITGIYDALDRRVYDGGFASNFLVWSEGEATPTGTAAWDNLIDYSEDTYNLVSSISGGSYLSWDGNDGIMHAVNNDPAITCPNAQFTGSHIRFCDGTTTDDVVGHEWFHGYTQETHGLIYLNQSGALNEAYSDIFGEVVDFLNGDGTDSPNTPRSTNGCSLFGASGTPSLTVNAPAEAAGGYFVGGAAFNPNTAITVTADVVAASPAEACGPIAGNVSGNIAIIDRGNCAFSDKVANAQAAGAVAAIVVNNAGDDVISMGGSNGSITIPSVFIGQTDGTTLKNTSNVSATIVLPASTDNTYRWLTGEDSSAFGGAIRDMWTPNCFGDPGKVSDLQYDCDFDQNDSGGVHTNSGIINHGFALLVDGGDYNGQSISAIGLTKATHLYWRTASVYQTPISGYSDHAAALQAACADLIGVNLSTLSTDQATTGTSGAVMNAGDCAQVDKIVLALDLNLQPTQCGFTTLLAQDPPALCADGETAVAVLAEDFDAGLGAFTAGSRAIVNPATFDVPDWTVAGDLPFGRAGQAAFGSDPVIGDCASDIEAGVTYMQSPAFTMPSGGRVKFEHSLSTERDFDGGNVKVSVNGGAYQLVPAAAFIYNAYNGSLMASDNPMGGEAAFHGADGGAFLSVWGQSQIDLSSVANAGDQVTLRFEMGTDGCNGLIGWYVDDVMAYSCEVAAADSDGDGVNDDVDNCTTVANPNQIDSNGDGYGNRCDADLNNDGIVNPTDLGIFRGVFLSADADADFNGDGVVNPTDLGILRMLFLLPPGPSALAP